MGLGRFPHSLVLIFAMIVGAQLLSYALTPGEFERDGRFVVPGTYRELPAEQADQARLEWHAAVSLIPRGMQAAGEIIFFVFIVGGVIAVMRRTGAIDAVIGTALARMHGRPVLLVAGMVTLFALGSSTIGMGEEYIPFIPVLVTMCLALKLDAMVALGIVIVGYGFGYGSAATNPFTVIIAQDIAGLPKTSGQWYRWIVFAVTVAIGVHHVLRYASRVRKDPTKSLVADVDYSEGFELPKDTALTPARIMVVLVFMAVVGVFAWGVQKYEWPIDLLAAMFLGVALVAALLGRISPNETARSFCEGAAEMTTTALLIGFARTIEVVLVEARVIDTVVYGIASVLPEGRPFLASSGMLVMQSVTNLFIPSGSGQAYVTMPLMSQLADLLGVTRQTAVLAYQYGDGFTNTIVPTNAVLMGMLALGRIPFQRWLRFMLPLLLKVGVVLFASLWVATAIGYA